MADIVMLDRLDRKLLFALDFHARDSYSELARKIGASKQVAEYRLKRLEQQGVIRGYFTVVNIHRLGYLYCRVFFSLQNRTEAEEKAFLDYLKSNKQVFWLFLTHGTYDVLVVYWAKMPLEFQLFVQSCMTRFGNIIKYRQETIVTNVAHFQDKFLVNSIKTEVLNLAETESIIKLDDVDRKILRMLSLDARSPLTGIAAKVDLSAVAVARRIKLMKKSGIILGYRPHIDHLKIGYGYYKMLLNISTPSEQNLRKVKSYLTQQPAVVFIIEGIGLPSDIDTELMLRTPLELHDFIQKMRKALPGLISDYSTFMFADMVKAEYMPF